MSATAVESKPKAKHLTVSADLHRLLSARSEHSGKSILRITEDKLWELFPEEQPEDVRARLTALEQK